MTTIPFPTLPRGAHFDLHMHSTRSDGRFAPEEVFRRCAAGGLDVISLTDHDLAAEGMVGEHLFQGQRIRVLGGAEVSGTHEGREYHLLVYFKGEIPAGFANFCRAQSAWRARRYESAVLKLGLPDLEMADDAAHEGDRALTRLHLAQALVEAGHADNVRDAFSRYLDRDHGNVPVCELSFIDAIKVAKGFGGLSSWAHPSVRAVKEHIGTFAEAGLGGLEGIRPFLSSKDRNFFRRTAKKHNLFLTGGSDFHGWRDEELGLFYIARQELNGFIGALRVA